MGQERQRNSFEKWIDNNKIATFCLFWGGLILLIIFLLSLRNTKPDINQDDRCGNLTGQERNYCIQQFESEARTTEGSGGHPLWNN